MKIDIWVKQIIKADRVRLARDSRSATSIANPAKMFQIPRHATGA